jgi:serine/threonine-protein kinase
VIGEGGMGTVFRAEHVLMRKTVAVKLLHPALGKVDAIAQRFTREAQSASKLEHPGIIDVTDFGRTQEGELYLAMELLEGESLAHAIARERLPLARAVAIVRQMAQALEHAHEMGVVHRDLKPENIMLCPGEPERVKLLDFGIAKMNDDTDGKQPLTQAGVAFGTPHYMSPEQAVGEPTDQRSDIYSCGVILFELLTGRKPFVADQAVTVIKQHLTKDPPAEAHARGAGAAAAGRGGDGARRRDGGEDGAPEVPE